MSFAEAALSPTIAEENGGADGKIERSQVPYAAKYQRFVVKSRSYEQQYSKIYNMRLTQMRDLVRAAAKKKWTDAGKWRECGKVIDLRPDGEGSSNGGAPSSEWVVVGCIYKDQPLKPSILDEYGGDRGLEVLASRANYASSDDALVLEDESGRVPLCAGSMLWGSAGSEAVPLDLDGHTDINKQQGSANKRRRVQHPEAADDDGDNDIDIEDVGAAMAASSSSSSSNGSSKGALKKKGREFPLQRMVATLVTGVVLAVRGTVTETGELAVSDICVPGLLRMPMAAGGASSSSSSSATALVPRPLPSPDPSDPTSSPRYVLLLSGLGFGALSNPKLASAVSEDYELCLHLLSDFINGLTGGGSGEGNEAAASARIARVIVAGNLLAPPLNATSAATRTAAASATYVKPQASSGGGVGGGSGGGSGASFSDRSLSVADQELLSAPMREADVWLSTIAATVPVDIMPGENDPANFTLPQQKMHPCLFPASARFTDTFKTVTNPYEAECNGVKMLGSAGQPVLDIARYASSSSVIVPGNEGAATGAGASSSSSSSSSSTVVISKSAGSMAATSSPSSSNAMDIDNNGSGEGAEFMKHQAASVAGVAGVGGAGGGFGGEEDGLDAEALPEASVVAAVSTTAGDRAMTLLAGTGAGAGHEARIAAAAQAAAEEASGAESWDTFEKRLAHAPLTVLSHTDILTNTLFWRHMAPTCPDTLSAYPFNTIDPFAMDAQRLPHILFAGGAPSFDTRLVCDKSDPASTQVRVISVPDFIRTRTAVLVDISKPELPVQPVSFRAML